MAILYLGYHGNGRHFELFQPPQKLPHTTVDIPTKWIIIWLPNHRYQFPTSKSTWKSNFAQIGGFLYFGGHFGFKMATIANQRWISNRNIIIYLETKFRPNWRIFVLGGHFVPWLPWQLPILNLFNPQKLPHTTVDIPTNFHEVWWKESNFFLNPPLFCFHGNCGKICPTDSDFFGLSRSTSCGCCSYQVSSISVQRVTCYDHFCVFQFFSILAVSMATAAILKIPKVVCISTQCLTFLWSFIDFRSVVAEKCVG